LKQRGLLEDTLVIWGGEFGRTPTSQKTGDLFTGRDHNMQAFSMWMAGGGVKGGFRYGQTDDFGHAVVENPVSLGEAVVAPFRRLGALVASTAERISAGAEKQLESSVAQATTVLQEGVHRGPAPPASTPPVPAAGSGRVRDILLTGGVTVAALGSSLAFIAKTVSEMSWHHVLISLGAVLLVILVPNFTIAQGKLRRRDRQRPKPLPMRPVSSPKNPRLPRSRRSKKKPNNLRLWN